jgi:hypothetical protein
MSTKNHAKLLTTDDTAGPTITSVTSGLGELVVTLTEIVFTSVNDKSATITKEDITTLVTISTAVIRQKAVSVKH